MFLHVQGSLHCSGSPTTCSCNKCYDGWEHRAGKCWQRCKGNAQLHMLPTVPQNPSSTVVADLDHANIIGAAVMTAPNSEDSTQTECTNNRTGQNDYHCKCDWISQVCILFHVQYWRVICLLGKIPKGRRPFGIVRENLSGFWHPSILNCAWY